MKLIIAFLFLIIFRDVSAAPAGLQRHWTSVSDPLLMGTYDLKFTGLPLHGKVADGKTYWSGSYWAKQSGNINYRWNSSGKEGFDLPSPSRLKVSSMTLEELKTLAPSEKFDLFTGRYDYPLVKEVATHASLKAKPWEGICHGWAAATMNYPEPMPVVAINPHGLKVPFGSNDIKALLSYYYAYHFKAPTSQVGKRCYNDSDCEEDLNAGAFHIILANRLGLGGKGFIADLDPHKQVWNHPINGYESLILEESVPTALSAVGTVRVLKIKTRVFYVSESMDTWGTVLGTQFQIGGTKEYFYELELDAESFILGGEWTSAEKPDFIWLKGRPEEFRGILSSLKALLKT
ncbi:MAG TPA: hypothetical protein VNJ01_13380 [Bacteriovoracaceae bacterium]|nr:hypothetical protein [Bacteriovoracaceae bacterium]